MPTAVLEIVPGAFEYGSMVVTPLPITGPQSEPTGAEDHRLKGPLAEVRPQA